MRSPSLCLSLSLSHYPCRCTHKSQFSAPITGKSFCFLPRLVQFLKTSQRQRQLQSHFKFTISTVQQLQANCEGPRDAREDLGYCGGNRLQLWSQLNRLPVLSLFRPSLLYRRTVLRICIYYIDIFFYFAASVAISAIKLPRNRNLNRTHTKKP